MGVKVLSAQHCSWRKTTLSVKLLPVRKLLSAEMRPVLKDAAGQVVLFKGTKDRGEMNIVDEGKITNLILIKHSGCLLYLS